MTTPIKLGTYARSYDLQFVLAQTRHYTALIGLGLLSACGGSPESLSPPAAAPLANLTSNTATVNTPAPPTTNLLSLQAQANAEGAAQTISNSAAVDNTHPFFKGMGNGRSCASCHQENQGWSITPEKLKPLFESTQGKDPVFRLVDGATSPRAAVATLEQQRLAYSLLLNKGLIRVALAVPANAEFIVSKIDDPYGNANSREISVFRRPLPVTNLKFITTVMWDSRETQTDPRSALCIKNSQPLRCFAAPEVNLMHQANSAVTGHAEAAQGLSNAEQKAIVDFEKSLFTAQVSSARAGNLNSAGALAGVSNLVNQNFYFGINDLDSGDYKTGAPFNREVFTLYTAWRGLDRPSPAPNGRPLPASAQNQLRAAIARGEQIFNNKPFTVSRVAGLNDANRANSFRATCSSCHNVPNVGGHALPRLFNTGVADANRRSADLPLYTLQNKATGEQIQTSDPGLAMQTGRWLDIARFKVPVLRGLEARSPYFHDGSAQNVEDLVKFYNDRFAIGFSLQEMTDLAEFLKTL